MEITGKIGGGGKALLKGLPWNKLGLQKGNIVLDSAREDVDEPRQPVGAQHRLANPRFSQPTRALCSLLACVCPNSIYRTVCRQTSEDPSQS